MVHAIFQMILYQLTKLARESTKSFNRGEALPRVTFRIGSNRKCLHDSLIPHEKNENEVRWNFGV